MSEGYSLNMAERPIHQTEPYSLREEYQPLLTRDIRPHFDKTHDQLYKMFTTQGASESSHMLAMSTDTGTQIELRASHFGPTYGQQVLTREEGDDVIVYEDAILPFNSVGRISHSEYTHGLYRSKTVVSIRDFPPGSSDPIVNEYLFDEHRSGIINATVAHTIPRFRGTEVRIEERRMVGYDFARLAIDLSRIQTMRMSGEPADGLPKSEYI